MGNKVNPLSFRLQVHKNWDHAGFLAKKILPNGCTKTTKFVS